MAVFESEALVLRTYNLAEADKIVVCLTRSHGLIRGVAKGCRKLKNRFGASLEPFTLIKLTYFQKENHELVSFNQTEILRSHFNLSSNDTILHGLAYIGDLLIDFSPPHQANETLFRMTNACLDAIASTPGDLQTVLRYFEVWLLKIEGFLPDLRRCSDCHKAFEAEESVYSGRDFAFRCDNCREHRDRVMSNTVRSQLRAIEKLPPGQFANESRAVDKNTKQEMSELTHQMITRILERLPRVRPTVASSN